MNRNSENWWVDALDPEKMAQEAQRQQELAVQAAAQEQQVQRREVLRFTGSGLIQIIKRYADQNQPAVLDQVAVDFQSAFPGADYRSALEALKAEGIVHELVSSTQGFMGTQTRHLHLLG
ncbi:hypothetical protein [Streptacidiphilus sp. PAMC 29251]